MEIEMYTTYIVPLSRYCVCWYVGIGAKFASFSIYSGAKLWSDFSPYFQYM